MRIKIIVKATNGEHSHAVRTAAERVVAEFGGAIPNERLLCFFDDVDCQVFKDILGESNRGFYKSINSGIPGGEMCPKYIASELMVDDVSSVPKPAFEHFIYLHGSICKDPVGLTMTFAHELHHFVQSVCSPIAASASRLVYALKYETGNPADWNDWFCFPHERDARIVAKRIALAIVGPGDVEKYVERRISEAVKEVDLRDWNFIQGMAPTETYDFPAATREAYRDLGPFRDQLVRILKQNKSDFPGVGVGDLEHLLSGEFFG